MMANSGEESRGFTYDVLLSFQGKDTRYKFVGHLVNRLREKGIKVFYDEDTLEIGKGISSALLRAIEESKISIIVFSQNYASSKWCLLELEKIIACTEKNNKQLAFPIFYHVDPSDIRNQNNSYGQSMIDHENLYGKESEKIQAWRSALTKAGHLTGRHIHAGSEAEHIEVIVKKVCGRIGIAPKPDDLVGRIEKLNDQQSRKLFCQKAFKSRHPKRGYEDVSARALSFAKGLPLAITAMASILSTEKGVKAWEDAMDDYERIPDKIQDLLRVNINALENYAETAFIDIGCLSKGERKEYRKNNIKKTNRVTPSSQYNDIYNYYFEIAAKDTKTNSMLQEFFPPPYNCTNTVQQVSAGTKFHSYDCKICKRRLTSFQALGGHMKSHKRSGRAEAITKARDKKGINMRNSYLEEEVSPLFDQMPSHTTNYKPKLRDSATEPVTRPNPTNSSRSNQNTTSIWSKNGLDTCKFLLIFKNGEVLDFQRLDNVDVIL